MPRFGLFRILCSFTVRQRVETEKGMEEIQTVVYFNLLLFSNMKAMENIVTEILHVATFTSCILVEAGASQLLEDLEACVSVCSCTRILVG